MARAHLTGFEFNGQLRRNRKSIDQPIINVNYPMTFSTYCCELTAFFINANSTVGLMITTPYGAHFLVRSESWKFGAEPCLCDRQRSPLQPLIRSLLAERQGVKDVVRTVHLGGLNLDLSRSFCIPTYVDLASIASESLPSMNTCASRPR